tara:strand:+ start:62 stop:1264 length:1203 start_codon:yes stop_codon:yes gene_type:complete
MAYKINRDDEFIVLPDGPVSAREVRKYMKQQRTPEFYELEAAEVIEVFVDEEDLPKILSGTNKGQPDWSKYGYINARMVISNTGSQNITLIAPMDSNIKEYPYPGEYVIVAHYFGEVFYTQKLNLLNKVDTNILPGLSKVQKPFLNESYKDNLPNIANSNIRQLNAEEGDITFNGRFGHSIRFGSNIKEIKTGDSTVPDTGKLNSPNIIIRAGQGVLESIPRKPVKENINLDGSSIWMTTDQKVDIKLDNSHSTFIWADKGSEGFGGNRITINSDGLILNSKKNNILMSSMGFIGLTANTEIGIEVPNDTGRVYLGDGMADQPVLGGDQTMELFGLLVDYLIEFTNQLAPAMGSIINSPVPIPHIPISCSSLVTKLQTLKTRIDEPKSKTVHVGHLRGPE